MRFHGGKFNLYDDEYMLHSVADTSRGYRGVEWTTTLKTRTFSLHTCISDILTLLLDLLEVVGDYIE